MLVYTFKIATLLLLSGLFVLVPVSCDSSSCPDCPCFSQSSYTLTLPDNIPQAAPFTALTATSPLELLVTYSLVGSAHFSVNQHTGALSTRVDLDYGTVRAYTLTERATDSMGNIGMASVAINLLQSSTSGNLLICTSTVVNAQVLEGITGTEHPLPTCFNGDGSVVSDSELTSTISGGNAGSWFTLTASSHLSNVLPLDYEAQSIHNLQVGVANSETPPRSTTISIIIVVSSVNEYPPVFNYDPIVLNIPESQAIGTVLSQVRAADQDDGVGDGTVTYSLLPQRGIEPVLAINPASGEIILIRPLDFESQQNHTFTIIATDNPSDISTRMNSTATLNLNVVDVNDNPPTFEHAAYAAQVSESAVAMAMVTTLSCDDLDTVNSDLTYSITAGNEAAKFSIDAATGEIRLRERIDYDDPASIILYTLTVSCRETAPPRRASEALAVVEVTGENEFRPDPGSTYQVRLREDTLLGTRIVQVHGRDRDRGLAGMLSYFLVSSRNSMYTCPEQFYIHSSTGSVYLISPLDFERDPHMYHCVVSVWDSQTPIQISEQDIFIYITDVNDAPPTCGLLPYRVQVAEDAAAGLVVMALSCTDPDSATLRYAFTDQSAPLFQVDQQGVITLNGALDYEMQRLHIIHVQVTDEQYSVNTSVFVTVTNVNENAPVFMALPSCSIPESAIQGSPVCTLQAMDSDQGREGVVQFSVASTGVPFDIHPESGVVFVTVILDAETTSEYVIQVRAVDHGVPAQSNSVDITVNIADINDNRPHMPGNLYVSVPENSPISTLVTTLVCTDSDASVNNSNIQFQMGAVMQELGSGTLVPVISPLFALDASTGDVTLLSEVDYESIRNYVMFITCHDQGSPPLATPSTVHIQVTPINEFPPVLSPASYSATIPEGVALGNSIMTVTATDDDAGVQGEVLYRIESGMGMGTSLPFWIHPQTGVISVVEQPQCHVSTSYSFQVVASDGATPPREARGDVSIAVDRCHLGTLTPVSNVHIASIAENAAAGERVLAVFCSSSRMLGASPNYRLIQSSDNFEVDRTSGDIRVRTPPDYEQFGSHLLNVQCYDHNHPEIFADMAVQISVIPANEYTPVFDRGVYDFDVLESTPLGARIGSVQATDGDRGRDGEVSYAVSEGSGTVMIDRGTGVIYLTRDLDRETQESMEVTVTARDGPSDSATARTGSARVVIHVLDDNDNWPVCNKTVFHVPISPLTQPSTVILDDLGCTDRDTGVNSQLHYSLAEASSKFSMDPITGRLTLAESLDPEDAVAYNVPVLVSDGGEVPYFTTVLVIVDLRQPFLEIEAGDGQGSKYGSLVDEEGLQNSVTIILPDFSKAIWEESSFTKDSFNGAVARSVTSFCAIYPEACSLVYGCAQFYGFTQSTSRRKRQAPNIDQSSNYANFVQPHVVVLPNMTSELAGENADSLLTSLQIRFYVKLPDQAERSPSRATNYVVPKNTLTEIVSQDKEVISAVVRNTVSPSLTQQVLNGWKVATIVIVAILSSAIVVSLVVAAIFIGYKIRDKRKTKVTPFHLPRSSTITAKLSTTSSKTSSSTRAVIGSEGTGEDEKQRIPMALAHFFSSQGQSSIPQQDSCNSSNSRKSSSNYSCLTSASMENNASRRGSTSPRRISDDIAAHAQKDKMETLEFEGIDDEEEEEVPFPYTRPTKQVQPPAGNRWSMH